jgi:hypothetical protein
MHEVYKQLSEETKVPAVQRKAFSEVLLKNKIFILSPGKINAMCSPPPPPKKKGNCLEE